MIMDAMLGPGRTRLAKALYLCKGDGRGSAPRDGRRSRPDPTDRGIGHELEDLLDEVGALLVGVDALGPPAVVELVPDDPHLHDLYPILPDLLLAGRLEPCRGRSSARSNSVGRHGDGRTPDLVGRERERHPRSTRFLGPSRPSR